MDFDSLPSHEKLMIISAYKTVSQMEETEFLKNYNPPLDKGFMWDDNNTVIKIMNKIHDNNDCHSGASLAYTMRWLQYILKNDIPVE
jgi:hypothetical protein